MQTWNLHQDDFIGEKIVQDILGQGHSYFDLDNLWDLYRGLVRLTSDFFDISKEYEEAASPEAKFVKDLDKFDMIAQAYEYELQEDKPGSLQQFYDSTRGKKTPTQFNCWCTGLN